MRLLIAAGIFPPDIGGPATYAERLASHWSQAGHEVRVVCYSSKTNGVSPYPVYRVERGRIKFFTFLTYLIILFRNAFWADIVYAQGPISGGLQSYIVHLLTRKPYLVKITGDYAWEQASTRYGLMQDIDSFQTHSQNLPFLVRGMRFLQRLVARNARCCILPCVYLQNMVIQWGVHTKHTSVIYNAAPVHDQLGTMTMDSGAAMVMSVGRLVPWKGFEKLLLLWPRIRERHPDAHLRIAGDGPDRKKLETMIVQLHLSSRVQLLGTLHHDELGEWYRRSDVFVLNSGYEGFSHAILEALSYGLACAVSDVGGNKEIIQDGKNGILFMYNDQASIFNSIERMLQDPEMTRRLRKEASRVGHRFSLERMLRETMMLISSYARHV